MTTRIFWNLSEQQLVAEGAVAYLRRIGYRKLPSFTSTTMRDALLSGQQTLPSNRRRKLSFVVGERMKGIIRAAMERDILKSTSPIVAADFPSPPKSTPIDVPTQSALPPENTFDKFRSSLHEYVDLMVDQFMNGLMTDLTAQINQAFQQGVKEGGLPEKLLDIATDVERLTKVQVTVIGLMPSQCQEIMRIPFPNLKIRFEPDSTTMSAGRHVIHLRKFSEPLSASLRKQALSYRHVSGLTQVKQALKELDAAMAVSS